MSSSLAASTPPTNTTIRQKDAAIIQRLPQPTLTNASNNAASTKRKILSSLGSGGKKNLLNGLAKDKMIDARDQTNTDYKGVYPKGLKFNAQVHMHGKLHYLGTFKTAKIAALVHDCAVLKHKLPLSKLNFPFQLPALPGASSKGNEERDADNNAQQQVVQRAPEKPKPSLAVYKGVSPNGNQFNAQITVDGEMKYFDTFRTAKIAALAYDCAVLRHKLPLSLLNFPFEIPELPTNDGCQARGGMPTNPRKKRKLPSPTSATSVGHTDGENIGVAPAQGTSGSTCSAFSIGISDLSDGFDDDEDSEEEEALPLVYWA